LNLSATEEVVKVSLSFDVTDKLMSCDRILNMTSSFS